MKPGWNQCLIGDLGKIVTGKTPSSSRPECFGKGFPFITPTDMHERRYAHTTERELSDEGAELQKSLLLPPHSIAVSCIGWQMGKAIITSRPSFTNQQLNTIIPDDHVDPRFLCYSLSTRREELLSLGSAAGVRTPILNKGAFSRLPITLPTKPIQEKIASILSTYDDLIENNAHRISILEEMAQALYREWFVRFRFPGHENIPLVPSPLGDIPQGWGKSLGDVLTLKRGYDLPQSKRRPGTIPIMSSSGVTDFHDEAKVRGPGVVTGRYGTLGEVFYVCGDFWPLNTSLYVQEFHGNSALIIVHLLRSLNLAHQNAAGAVPGVNRNALHLLPVAFPPIELQQQIEPTFQSLQEGIYNLHRRTEILREVRDFLLPKLISGQLDVEHLDIDVGETVTA